MKHWSWWKEDESLRGLTMYFHPRNASISGSPSEVVRTEKQLKRSAKRRRVGKDRENRIRDAFGKTIYQCDIPYFVIHDRGSGALTAFYVEKDLYRSITPVMLGVLRARCPELTLR